MLDLLFFAFSTSEYRFVSRLKMEKLDSGHPAKGEELRAHRDD